MTEFSRRALLGGGAAALALTQLPLAASAAALPSRSGLPWSSGARDANPDAFVAAFRGGRQLDVLMTFSKKATWAEIRNSGRYNYVNMLSPTKGNRREAIVVSYPMFPLEQNPRDHGTTLWRRAANGEFDHHHDAAAASFATHSQQLIFRVGWEWNVKNFAPWVCTDVAHAADYIQYYRRIVARLRARVPGCLIDWCSGKKGATNAAIDNWYPGNDHIDFIGQDKYDWYSAARNLAEWNLDYGASYLNGPKGVGTWLAYARSKGKRLSIPEWGLVSGNKAGGGDNAFFIQKMFEFFQNNAGDIAYECYFNDDTHITHTLQRHPNGAKAYQLHY